MIEKYIFKLLEKNNRAIVPDLGAFLKGSGSSKNIFFNEFIKVDDGLLINSIIENEKLSKSDAVQEVAEFIAKVKKELSGKQKSIIIKGIGILYKDKNDRIKLEIDEKLIVPKVSVKKLKPEKKEPMKKEPEKKETVPPVKRIVKEQPIIKNPTPTKKEEPKEKKKNKSLLLILLILILIIIIVILGYLFQDEIFGNKAKEEAAKIELTKKAEKEKQAAILEKENQAKELKAKEEAEKELEKATIEKTKKELEIKNQKYYLVGGVFKEVQNAKDLLSELEYEGFTKAKYIEINGLNYLCYASFNTYSKAKTEFQNVKEKGYEVWILKH